MRLRELSASLLRLQDEERRRIARDLHDSTGQTLTALKMSLVSLQSAVQQNAPTEELFEDLDALADQAVKEIRTTSHLLHPPLLDEAGFDSAARWYLEGFSKRSQVKVEFHLGSVCRLPEPVEMVLFRVLQESLTNVLRHSGATRAEVRFDVADEAVLSVRDYGEGIPSDRLEQFRLTGGGVGVGLSGMRERARELGGRLDVRSDDCGTIVTVTIPISTDGQKPAPDSGRNAPAA
jgi:signal transduction histidine kinase